jgi:protein-S-isoprenylcysteine O-methyltransferase Ste14
MGPGYAWDWGPVHAIDAIWVVWLLSWLIGAAWTGRTAARPTLGSQLAYRLMTAAGTVLLVPQLPPFGPAQLWISPPLLGWAMVTLTVAGFAFCWWARLYLGRLWSGSVTRKQNHNIVVTGPYALVRHPIYTGLIVAAAATAIERGTAPGLVGLCLITIGCWIKARLEESFLRNELGVESYDAYARRTGMLLPFL